MNNTLPSITKQLTIAIMDAKNREVIEGYIPVKGRLYIYSIKNEIATEIPCNISEDSKIEITSNGFKFNNDNKLYEYTLK